MNVQRRRIKVKVRMESERGGDEKKEFGLSAKEGEAWATKNCCVGARFIHTMAVPSGWEAAAACVRQKWAKWWVVQRSGSKRQSQ